MGHNGVRYTENGGDNNMVKMMVGGIRWVAGEGRKSDCSGTVWSSFSRQVLVSDAINPIGIDVAKDGKVYWSEIGGPTGARVQGYIKMHDPKGPANNKTTVAHDPHARRSRPRPRTACWACRCSRASTWPTPTSATCSCTTRRATRDWPTTGAAQVVGLQPDQPLHADRGRHGGHPGL